MMNENISFARLIFGLASLVFILIELPHILIVIFQQVAGAQVSYTPNNLNGSWARFDDIVKLYPVFNLLDNGTIWGHPTIPYHTDRLFASVLPESLTSVLFAGVAVLLGRDAPYYVMPVFAGGCAAAMAWLTWTSTGDRLMSLALPLLSIFGVPFIRLDLLTSPADIATYFTRALGALDDSAYELNSFYRLYQNGTSYGAFVLLILALAKIWEEKESHWRYVMLASACLAAVFYLYLFYGIVSGLIVAILWTCAGIAVLRGSTGAGFRFRALTIVAAVGVVAALPILWDVLLFLHSSSSDWLTRMGVTSSPFWANREILLIAVFIALVAPAGGWKAVSITLILSTIAIENAHYLFGFNLQVGHAYTRVAEPLLILFSACACLSLARWPLTVRLRQPLRFVFGSMAIMSMIAATIFAYAYARNTHASQGLTRDQVALAHWFNTLSGTAKPVVGTLSPELDVALNLHGNVYSYLQFSGQTYASVTNGEIADRLATLVVLGGGNEQILREFLAPSGNEVERRLVYYYLGNGVSHHEYLSEGENQALARINLAMHRAREDIRAAIAEYRLDYFVFSTLTEKSRMFSGQSSPLLCRIIKIGAYEIYKVHGADACPE